MNSTATSTGPKQAFNWREDLSTSRDLSRNEVRAFGLRLKELTRLRIKDVELKRGVLTIRGGKGDRDRITVIPNSLKPALELQLARSAMTRG